jgi:hypothetical protein
VVGRRRVTSYSSKPHLSQIGISYLPSPFCCAPLSRKIPTMTTPPSSPIADNYAIAALQNAADDSSSPYRPSAASAVAALNFQPTNKRQSAPPRSGISSGPNSPIKKRQNTTVSPLRRVTIDDEAPRAMHIDGTGYGELCVDQQHRTPHPNTAIPSITPSPLSQAIDTPMPPAPATVQPSKKSSKATTTAKKKPPAFGSRPLDIESSRCFTFIRGDVFDNKRFSAKSLLASPQYTDEEMQKFDDTYQKQLYFNFAEKRAAQKKQAASAPRASRSTAVSSLDDNYAIYSSTTTDFKDLSRYILEDLITCQALTSFLLCIPADSGAYWGLDLAKAASLQAKSNNGGDKCKISGRAFFCFKVTIDYCPLHEEIVNKMTNSRFQTLLNDKSGGFRVSLDGVDCNKLFVKWWDVLFLPREVMFFGMPFSSNRPMDYLFLKKNQQYAHHIFRHFSAQYYGDAKQSALLYAAYLKCCRGLERNAKEEALTREARQQTRNRNRKRIEPSRTSHSC